jgi:hypothetical protein
MSEPLFRAAASPSAVRSSKLLLLRPMGGSNGSSNKGSLEVAMQLHGMMMEGLPVDQADEGNTAGLEVPALESVYPDSSLDKCQSVYPYSSLGKCEVFANSCQLGSAALPVVKGDYKEPLEILPSPVAREGALKPMLPPPSWEGTITQLIPTPSREGALAASVLKGSAGHPDDRTQVVSKEGVQINAEVPQTVNESTSQEVENNVKQALMGLFSDM